MSLSPLQQGSDGIPSPTLATAGAGDLNLGSLGPASAGGADALDPAHHSGHGSSTSSPSGQLRGPNPYVAAIVADLRQELLLLEDTISDRRRTLNEKLRGLGHDSLDELPTVETARRLAADAEAAMRAADEELRQAEGTHAALTPQYEQVQGDTERHARAAKYNVDIDAAEERLKAAAEEIKVLDAQLAEGSNRYKLERERRALLTENLTGLLNDVSTVLEATIVRTIPVDDDLSVPHARDSVAKLFALTVAREGDLAMGRRIARELAVAAEVKSDRARDLQRQLEADAAATEAARHGRVATALQSIAAARGDMERRHRDVAQQIDDARRRLKEARIVDDRATARLGMIDRAAAGQVRRTAASDLDSMLRLHDVDEFQEQQRLQHELTRLSARVQHLEHRKRELTRQLQADGADAQRDLWHATGEAPSPVRPQVRRASCSAARCASNVEGGSAGYGGVPPQQLVALQIEAPPPLPQSQPASRQLSPAGRAASTASGASTGLGSRLSRTVTPQTHARKITASSSHPHVASTTGSFAGPPSSAGAINQNNATGGNVVTVDSVEVSVPAMTVHPTLQAHIKGRETLGALMAQGGGDSSMSILATSGIVTPEHRAGDVASNHETSAPPARTSSGALQRAVTPLPAAAVTPASATAATPPPPGAATPPPDDAAGGLYGGGGRVSMQPTGATPTPLQPRMRLMRMGAFESEGDEGDDGGPSSGIATGQWEPTPVKPPTPTA